VRCYRRLWEGEAVTAATRQTRVLSVRMRAMKSRSAKRATTSCEHVRRTAAHRPLMSRGSRHIPHEAGSKKARPGPRSGPVSSYRERPVEQLPLRVPPHRPNAFPLACRQAASHYGGHILRAGGSGPHLLLVSVECRTANGTRTVLYLPRTERWERAGAGAGRCEGEGMTSRDRWPRRR
jgi:hypothetical protein